MYAESSLERDALKKLLEKKLRGHQTAEKPQGVWWPRENCRFDVPASCGAIAIGLVQAA